MKYFNKTNNVLVVLNIKNLLGCTQDGVLIQYIEQTKGHTQNGGFVSRIRACVVIPTPKKALRNNEDHRNQLLTILGAVT